MDRKRKTLACPTIPSSSSRRRRLSQEDHVDAEWRDWASLPQDVLCIVVSKLPRTDILLGVGHVCSPWRRLEPLLWRNIDLSERGLWYGGHHKQPPAGWKAMALAAVNRSAGQCESFCGHVDVDVLLHLASRAPLLRNLYVAHWPRIDDKELTTEIVKKLPLLQRLGICGGLFQRQLLVALLDHCPRLELLDVSYCRPTFRVWQEPIATRIHCSTIKKILLPHIALR